MDYGKFLYEKSKREREARRSQKQTEVKEIRLRPKTGEHDIAYKIRDARRFLNRGAKVKVRIRFRGREITHPEVARDLLDRIAEPWGAAQDVHLEEWENKILLAGSLPPARTTSHTLRRHLDSIGSDQGAGLSVRTYPMLLRK